MCACVYMHVCLYMCGYMCVGSVCVCVVCAVVDVVVCGSVCMYGYVCVCVCMQSVLTYPPDILCMLIVTHFIGTTRKQRAKIFTMLP